MVLLEVLEVLVMAAVVALTATEIVIPMLKGTGLFPHFRSRQAGLERELIRRRQEDEEARLEREAAALKRRADMRARNEEE